MAFIQAQQSVRTHRKTLRLARLLGEDRHTTLDRLVTLWLWFLDNAPDGELDEDVDDHSMADVMGWSEEIGDPSHLVDAPHTAAFLAFVDERWRVVGSDDLIAHAAAPESEPAGALQDELQDGSAGEEE